MKTDFHRLFKAIGDVILEALKPITAKLAELDARRPERGEKGATGEQGEPGQKGLAGERGERGDTGPKGDRGETGEKGMAGERGDLGLKGDQGERGEAGPKGDLGEKGMQGPQGEQGTKGDQGEKGDKGDIGATGKDGADGKEGKDGKDGDPGAAGQNGADGKSITADDVIPLLEGAVAKWMLEVERRIMDTAQRAVEAMPKPRDGIDGINADQMVFALEPDTRVFSVSYKDRVLLSQVIPIPKYEDVWSEQYGVYAKGLMVTFGGSVWIAKRDTTSKPGTDDSWQLCVKKGRDGK